MSDQVAIYDKAFSHPKANDFTQRAECTDKDHSFYCAVGLGLFHIILYSRKCPRLSNGLLEILDECVQNIRYLFVSPEHSQNFSIYYQLLTLIKDPGNSASDLMSWLKTYVSDSTSQVPESMLMIIKTLTYSIGDDNVKTIIGSGETPNRTNVKGLSEAICEKFPIYIRIFTETEEIIVGNKKEELPIINIFEENEWYNFIYHFEHVEVEASLNEIADIFREPFTYSYKRELNKKTQATKKEVPKPIIENLSNLKENNNTPSFDPLSEKSKLSQITSTLSNTIGLLSSTLFKQGCLSKSAHEVIKSAVDNEEILLKIPGIKDLYNTRFEEIPPNACKICNTSKPEDEFNLISCGERACRVCTSCRTKNETQCPICSRVYMPYEKEDIQVAIFSLSN